MLNTLVLRHELFVPILLHTFVVFNLSFVACCLLKGVEASAERV